jgi:hypothetical protein
MGVNKIKKRMNANGGGKKKDQQCATKIGQSNALYLFAYALFLPNNYYESFGGPYSKNKKKKRKKQKDTCLIQLCLIRMSEILALPHTSYKQICRYTLTGISMMF